VVCAAGSSRARPSEDEPLTETAPRKRLVWFENSAHTPHLDEPERFRDLLRELHAAQPAGT